MAPIVDNNQFELPTVETPGKKRRRNADTNPFLSSSFSDQTFNIPSSTPIHNRPVDGSAFENPSFRYAAGGGGHNKENYNIFSDSCMEVKSIAELANGTTSGENPFEVIRKPPTKKKKKNNDFEESCFVNPGLNLQAADKPTVNPFEIVRSEEAARRENESCFVNGALNIKGKDNVGERVNPFEITRPVETSVGSERVGTVGEGLKGIENPGLEMQTYALAVPFTPSINHRINFQDTLLVFYTLGGGPTVIDPMKGETCWTIADELAIRVPSLSDMHPLYLPDPRGGSLYTNRNPRSKDSRSSLTRSALCRSSDGILYPGKKRSDDRFLIDLKTSRREKVLGFGTPLDGDKTESIRWATWRAVYLGRTQYTVMMYDSQATGRNSKPCNVTYFDYTSHVTELPASALTPCQMLAKNLVFSPEPTGTTDSNLITPKRNATVTKRKSLSVISEEPLDIGEELDCYQLELENSMNEAKARRQVVTNGPAGGSTGVKRKTRRSLIDVKHISNLSMKLKQLEDSKDEGTEKDPEPEEELAKVIEEPPQQVPTQTTFTVTKETTIKEEIRIDITNPDVQFEEVDDFEDEEQDVDLFANPAPFQRAYRKKEDPVEFKQPTPLPDVQPGAAAAGKGSKMKDAIRRSFRKLIHPKTSQPQVTDLDEKPKEGLMSTIRHSLRRKTGSNKPKQLEEEEHEEYESVEKVLEMSIIAEAPRAVFRQPASGEYKPISTGGSGVGAGSAGSLLRSSLRRSTKDVKRHMMKSVFKKEEAI